MIQTDLLRHALDALERLALPHMVVGSIASYGEYRFTNGIDIIVALSEPGPPAFLAAFPGPEFYVSPDAIRDAIFHRRT